jgi:transglutaminase-like putative cysteine protease
MSIFVRNSILALLALALAGCATAVRDESLRVALYNYSAAVRWNEIGQAAGFLDPQVQESQPFTAADRERWSQVQVTRYLEGPQSLDADGNVRQTVQVELADRDTQAVRTIVDRQVWRYDAVAKKWWLTTGLPNLDAAR